MFTPTEQKAFARLEWAEQFRQRTKLLLLLLGVATMAAAAYIFFLDLHSLPAKGEPASPENLSMFWPTFFIAAGFWMAGLFGVVRAIGWWRGDPTDVLLIAVARELSRQENSERIAASSPESSA
jgi:hypothetical protein